MWQGLDVSLTGKMCITKTPPSPHPNATANATVTVYIWNRSEQGQNNGEMKLASATLWHFFSPWFESVPSIQWVDPRHAQESFFQLLLISTHKKEQEQICNMSTNLAGSNGMYRRNFECIEWNFPISARPKIVQLFWCFKQQQQKKMKKKPLQSRLVLCRQTNFWEKKKNLIFWFHFDSLFLCTEPRSQ